jgi:hypothetical protein
MGIRHAGSSSQLSRPPLERRRDEGEYTDCPYFANKKVLPSQLFFV